MGPVSSVANDACHLRPSVSEVGPQLHASIFAEIAPLGLELTFLERQSATYDIMPALIDGMTCEFAAAFANAFLFLFLCQSAAAAQRPLRLPAPPVSDGVSVSVTVVAVAWRPGPWWLHTYTRSWRMEAISGADAACRTGPSSRASVSAAGDGVSCDRIVGQVSWKRVSQWRCAGVVLCTRFRRPTQTVRRRTWRMGARWRSALVQILLVMATAMVVM